LEEPAPNLTTLFASRNLEGEMKALYKAIGNTDANYVMMLREAVWPAQATIDHYLTGIDRVWGRGEEDVRDSFNQAESNLLRSSVETSEFLILTQDVSYDVTRPGGAGGMTGLPFMGRHLSGAPGAASVEEAATAGREARGATAAAAARSRFTIVFVARIRAIASSRSA
jgi:hypothetical protein